MDPEEDYTMSYRTIYSVSHGKVNKYKNKSIAEVLNMTVEEGYLFFINIPS